MPELHTLARYVVFAAFAASVLAALGSWLVRTRRVSPFGTVGRTLRAVSDVVVRPLETRLVRAGGNPVQAGWWLVVGVAAVGVVLLALLDWAIGALYRFSAAWSGGPRGLLALLIGTAYAVVVTALAVRVVGGWLGFFRYARWMRPAYALTDWLVEPIRRGVPPMGGFDWSPLVAWFVLWVLKTILLSLLVAV
jgi:YggT family protein